jgi:hypothetical protein
VDSSLIPIGYRNLETCRQRMPMVPSLIIVITSVKLTNREGSLDWPCIWLDLKSGEVKWAWNILKFRLVIIFAW